MNTTENTAISCETALRLLDEEPNSPLLAAHLAQCADCRAEARIREMIHSLCAEVPAGLTESVMDKIRAQRVLEASRLRRMRRIGALAAAAVLVPVSVILAPILLRTDRAVMTDQSLAETVFTEESTSAVPELILTTATAAPSETFSETYPETAPETAAVPETAAETTTKAPMMFAKPPILQTEFVTTEAVPPQSAPDYVTKKAQDTTQKSGGITTMTADDTAEPLVTTYEAVPLDPAYSVIVSLVDAHEVMMFKVSSSKAVITPADLCRRFDITREAFENAAAALNLSFTEEELREIFGADSSK